MTWTYTNSPIDTPTDEIHYLVGDTDPLEKLVQDEEIEYFLLLYPKPAGKPAYLAAAAAADAIAARFARRAQRSIGSLSIAANQQYEHYTQIAAALRVSYLTNGLGPAGENAGGFTKVRAGAPVLGGGGTGVL